jgi:hypothetical protein
MDLSADREALARGKRATTPKHGKKPENRLYSAFRRGNPSKGGDGEIVINPDASIAVVAVCGNEAITYSKGKKVRSPQGRVRFDNHGQAVQFAIERDAMERRYRDSRESSERVSTPFYQVKVAGVVIDQTNSRERAHAELRSGGARPKELWLITDSSSAELLDRIAA